MYNKEPYVEIDIVNLLPRDSYVTLDPEFRILLAKEIVKKFQSYKSFSEIINVNRRNFNAWMLGRRVPLKILIKCTELLGLSKNSLFNSIKDVTGYYRTGAIYVKDWKLVLDEEFAEWLGLLRGDGSVTYGYTKVINTLPQLCLFFSEFAIKKFTLNQNKIQISIFITGNEGENYKRKILNSLFKRGYKNIRFYIKELKMNKIIFDFCINSTVLASTIKGVFNESPSLIKKSPDSVKAAYVRGFSSAEGYVHNINKVRYVELSQKNEVELEFIRFLLKSLGIKVNKFKHTSNVFRLMISGKRNLETFQKFIGFGRHEIRNLKLKKALSEYEFQVYKSKEERAKEIIEQLKETSTLTAKEISNKIGLNIRRTRIVLDYMVDRDLISFDLSYPRTYFTR